MRSCFLWMSKESGSEMEFTLGEDAVKTAEMATKDLEQDINLVDNVVTEFETGLPGWH